MTTLVRWSPLRDTLALQNELSRMMNGLFEGGDGRESKAWVPMLDAWETDSEVVYSFDLPGVSQERISVEVENGTLTVSAERERTAGVSRENLRLAERRFGTFSRSIGLPPGVSEDAIEATYDDGVLEIHVPKPEQPKPRRIEVGGTAESNTIEGTAAAR
jgi:HSP20 family protein